MDRESPATTTVPRAPGLILRIRGAVQGVGFRPFIYRLAREHGLRGMVSNVPYGVLVEATGTEPHLKDFLRAIPERRPPLARITDIETEWGTVENREDFRILESGGEESPTALIPPDIAVCDACLEELFDADNRRYRYPFINCTDCGPRYTLIRGLPYDRPLTTMTDFTMCPDCQAEYDDPANRRFHAQPNACAACGPRVFLTDSQGREVDGPDPIHEAIERLQRGEIVAIRGIGGFHLAVDAANDSAVRRLRERKHREEKPLALMAASLARVSEFCRLGERETDLLSGREKPITVLEKLLPSRIAPSVAPGQSTLGVMLPYTPLHALLLDSSLYAAVLTSGNESEEPIACGNREAIERLGTIADWFLLHNREIYRRADDSVVRIALGAPRLLRRSRGYSPLPVLLRDESPSILAVGGQLKNTICITRGREAFLSPHIGELDNVETFEAFRSTIAHFRATLGARPAAVAHDLHPEYLSTRWALESSDLPAIGVQHHHAHIAAVLAEHGIEGPVVGLALDGTGYGLDGQIWGGEILVANLRGFSRAAHLTYVPLPGGEVAIRQPWRMALAWLYRLYGRNLFFLKIPFVETLDLEQAVFLIDVLEAGVVWPKTSSCGRLFDAIAALCGIRSHLSYEGQAAMELEAAASGMEADCGDDSAPREARSAGAEMEIGVEDLVWLAVHEIARRVPVPEVAACFHRRLAGVLVSHAASIARKASLDQVALGGGCFQNQILLSEVTRGLEARGLKVLVPEEVPAGDGGLALGQAAVAAARLGDH